MKAMEQFCQWIRDSFKNVERKDEAENSKKKGKSEAENSKKKGKSEADLSQKGYLESVCDDIDRIKAMIKEKKENGDENLDISGLISESFQQMVSLSPDSRHACQAWVKYLGFSVKYGDQIPSGLLAWLSEENYRTVFSFVKNYVGKLGSQWKGEEIKENKAGAVIQLCDYVLENLHSDDIPALMMKGQLLRVRGDYANAEALFERIAEREFNGLTSLIDCYNEELCQQLNAMWADRNNREARNRVRILNGKIRDLFARSEQTIKEQIEGGNEDQEIKVQYVALVAKNARWERDSKNYEVSYQMLDAVPVNFPEYYRVLLEKGLIHQHQGTQRKPNPLYDMDKAIAYFLMAEKMLEEGENVTGDVKRARKSALMPLANSYLVMGNATEARAICERVLSIDPKEQRAIDLLKRLDDQSASV